MTALIQTGGLLPLSHVTNEQVGEPYGSPSFSLLITLSATYQSCRVLRARPLVGFLFLLYLTQRSADIKRRTGIVGSCDFPTATSIRERPPRSLFLVSSPRHRYKNPLLVLLHSSLSESNVTSEYHHIRQDVIISHDDHSSCVHIFPEHTYCNVPYVPVLRTAESSLLARQFLSIATQPRTDGTFKHNQMLCLHLVATTLLLQRYLLIIRYIQAKRHCGYRFFQSKSQHSNR